MLFALLLQELFLLKIVKFARPTFLILFTFHREAVKWMGKKENDLYLLYKMSFKIFSEMSSTFTAEVLWLCSHMLHVLAPPLKEIQVITLLSIVYTDICVCPRLSRRLGGVRHSAASELPCTSQYLRAGNGWRFQQPLRTRGWLLHRAWAGASLEWVDQRLGLRWNDEDLQHWADTLGEKIIWLRFTSFLSTARAEAREESTTLRITTRSLFWHQWHQVLVAQCEDTC